MREAEMMAGNDESDSTSGPKQSNTRPTVMITTYYECNSKFRQASKRDTKEQLEDEDNKQTPVGAASKCENSTNFFINNLRRPHVRGRVLSNLIFSQIRGPTGSVRGHKDVVRKSLEGIKVTYSSGSGGGGGQARRSCSLSSNSCLSFSADSCSLQSALSSQRMSSGQLDDCQEYLAQLCDDEQDCCVAYTTTLGVIRRTFEDSKLLRSILNLNLIKYEERDIYLNQDYRRQLKLRLNSFIVPAVFVDGHHLGGVQELELMNENGELQQRLAKFKMTSPSREVCLCCGNARFIACLSCNGSRKSAIHHFKFNSIALRCIKCDKNDGLVQCPACSSPATCGLQSNATIKEVDENNNNNNAEVHVLDANQTDKPQFSSC